MRRPDKEIIRREAIKLRFVKQKPFKEVQRALEGEFGVFVPMRTLERRLTDKLESAICH